MSGAQQVCGEVVSVTKNKELQRKVKRFLDILYRYDYVGKDAYYKIEKSFYKLDKSHYCMIVGRTYLWIDAPYLRLVVKADGSIFWHKNYRSCSRRCLGHIDSFLDEAQWGKHIRRIHTRALRGTGYVGSGHMVEYHDLVVGVVKKCICGRVANVTDTVVGPRCQYCRGSDVRHMNIVRQLGGTPTANGRPLSTNQSYYKD